MEVFNKEVLASLIRGDVSSMELVYNNLFGQVYNYAKNYVVDSEQAKEITQDSFLTLWEKRQNLRPDSNIKAFLLHIARNKSLNFFKKQQVNRNYANYLKHSEQMINYHALKDKTAEWVLMQELEALIAKTLEELPEPCRKVFDMSRVENLSYAEIAEKLGISVKTVEYRMMHTLRLFRKNLRPYLPLIVLLMSSSRSNMF